MKEEKVALKDLSVCEKETCLKLLSEVGDAELWDVFLEVQADLFFESEAKWLGRQSWWQEARRVLEMGSGNGSYLSRLMMRFTEKTFVGIEQQSGFVVESTQRFAGERLRFQEGDAEVDDPSLQQSADVVLFRLTLQHLKDPVMALQNAWRYLADDGYVLIIDACDEARRTSHPIPIVEEMLPFFGERQRSSGQGNRKVTLDLLGALESGSSPLGALYTTVFTSLAREGEILSECIRLQGMRDRRVAFTQGLLFLAIAHRKFQVPFDCDRAYDQFQDYLADESAWSTPGVHVWVLKKKQLL